MALSAPVFKAEFRELSEVEFHSLDTGAIKYYNVLLAEPHVISLSKK